MNDKTVGERIRYAKQFVSVLQTGDAQSLLEVTPDKRIHAMKGLASLSRFLGCYDTWLAIRQRYNLKWSTGNESLAALSLFFDDSKTIDKMLSWVNEVIKMLPTTDMQEAIKWNCLTGLRPNESLAALRLIKDPEQFKRYYEPSACLLRHYIFPDVFIRRTKTAYVSIMDEQLLGIGQKIGKIPTYESCSCNVTLNCGAFSSTRTELEAEILSRGGSLHTKEKRDVTIRVRKWTKDKLKTMGSSGNDNDDVIFMLIDFWEKHHKDG